MTRGKCERLGAATAAVDNKTIAGKMNLLANIVVVAIVHHVRSPAVRLTREEKVTACFVVASGDRSTPCQLDISVDKTCWKEIACTIWSAKSGDAAGHAVEEPSTVTKAFKDDRDARSHVNRCTAFSYNRHTRRPTGNTDDCAPVILSKFTLALTP
ncbi:hypothetical protein EGR_10210 [Echinococcus granulosus]|uniref:Uncharacterized protein n=1 Tax=Echinococcus granulosus TaxID=6210 RepID=W6U1J5_ECHGR|nr:hypothetical protein EGR_10210 [Echinococcus granulosus]EUB54928.1 hypothetical protein EGR_10210 [Echinococcus granulosus]